MSKDKSLTHAIAWGIQHIYQVNKEAHEVLKDEEMEEKEKLKRVHGPNGTDYRLLNLMVLMKPLIEQAHDLFPEHKDFFKWFDEKWAVVEEKGYIKGACGCKGCKEEDKEQQNKEA